MNIYVIANGIRQSQTMPSYNNSDSYIRKPRSYREARKRRETRPSRGVDKWSDVNKHKRREMKFRSNRRYDKLHIVRNFSDDTEEDVANTVETRYDIYASGYKHLERLIKSDNCLSYYDNPVIINELLCSLLNTCDPVVLELDVYDIYLIMQHYWY